MAMNFFQGCNFGGIPDVDSRDLELKDKPKLHGIQVT